MTVWEALMQASREAGYGDDKPPPLRELADQVQELSADIQERADVLEVVAALINHAAAILLAADVESGNEA